LIIRNLEPDATRRIIVGWAAQRGDLDPNTEYEPDLFAAIAGTALQIAVNRCGPGSDRDLPAVLDGVFGFFARGATLLPPAEQPAR
jgi:hypothetical protein